MKRHIALAMGIILFSIPLCGQSSAPAAPQAQPPGFQGHSGPNSGQRAFGTVASVGVDRFDLKNTDGSTQTVVVNDQTSFRQARQDIHLEDLKAEDRVMVRGQMNSNHEFVATVVRRITAEEAQRFQNAGDRVFGQIVSIENNQIKLRNPRQGDQTVVVNEQTQFMKEGQAITVKDLKVGDRIFAVGKQAAGQFLATRVNSGPFQHRGPGWGGPPQ